MLDLHKFATEWLFIVTQFVQTLSSKPLKEGFRVDFQMVLLLRRLSERQDFKENQQLADAIFFLICLPLPLVLFGIFFFWIGFLAGSGFFGGRRR